MIFLAIAFISLFTAASLSYLRKEIFSVGLSIAEKTNAVRNAEIITSSIFKCGDYVVVNLYVEKIQLSFVSHKKIIVLTLPGYDTPESMVDSPGKV